MSDSTDLAVSLPADTGTFTASSMLPVGLLDTNHVLLLADDVAPDEVEALAAQLIAFDDLAIRLGAKAPVAQAA